MLKLLYASCPIALWVITAINLGFMVLLFSKYVKTKNILFLLSGLLTVGPQEKP